jgi:hypothetical protein
MTHTKQKRLTRGEAIRAKGLDCFYLSAKVVRLCPYTDCSLYPYRLGREVKNAEHTTDISPKME